MPQQKTKAEGLVALLTPVAKAFFTDVGLENCIQGQQVFGGHGYIREWGQEQLVRDVRIAQIYEGTNGIQALDLMGRKTVANDGKLFGMFAEEMREFLNGDLPAGMDEFAESLENAIAELEDLTKTVYC